MCVTEAIELLPGGPQWGHEGIEPYSDVKIFQQDPSDIANHFVEIFHLLKKAILSNNSRNVVLKSSVPISFDWARSNFK
jgi:hypothetical protein